jgi:hypothetical protein
MKLYTKLGSIPTLQAEAKEGWTEVQAKPDTPKDKEVVWIDTRWITRPIKPENLLRHLCKWNGDSQMWVQYELPKKIEKKLEVVEMVVDALSTAQVTALETTSL